MDLRPLPQGELIAGKYRVVRVVGKGGMGVVYEAVHEVLGQRVAVKVCPLSAERVKSGARFLAEARAAARLQSDHVAKVIDFGAMESGELFMVMELLEGRDLAGLLKEKRHLPCEEAVGYLLQALEALAEAHARGLVHRDLKPANLFLVKRPGSREIVKVLDFGIAKALGARAHGLASEEPMGDLTSTEMLLGTPAYMSPEQLRSPKNVDHRTDIWSLGVILYELIAGVRPFAANTAAEYVSRVLTSTPDPIGRHVLDVHPAVVKALQKCLTGDLDARFPNVAALADALLPARPQSESGVIRIREIAAVRYEISAVERDTSAPAPEPSALPATEVVSNDTGGLNKAETKAAWGKGAVAGQAASEVPKRPVAVRIAVMLGAGALALFLLAAAVVLAMRGREKATADRADGAPVASAAAGSSGQPQQQVAAEVGTPPRAVEVLPAAPISPPASALSQDAGIAAGKRPSPDRGHRGGAGAAPAAKPAAAASGAASATSKAKPVDPLDLLNRH